MSARIQRRAAPSVWRGAALIFVAPSFAACGPAATRSSHGGGGGPSSGSTPLASRILPASALQPQLAHGPTVLIFIATGCASCAADVGQLRQALASYPVVQRLSALLLLMAGAYITYDWLTLGGLLGSLRL